MLGTLRVCLFVVAALGLVAPAVLAAAGGSQDATQWVRLPQSRASAQALLASALPHQWALSGAADPDAAHTLLFVVTPRGLDGLEAALMAVSDPASDTYGQHWAPHDLAAFANPEGTAAVLSYLSRHGVTRVDVTPHGEYVKAWLTVRHASQLLRTQFHTFRRGNTTIARCVEGFLPAPVARHVSVVGYTTSLPPVGNDDGARTGRTRVRSGTGSDEATPKLISTYYGIANNTVATPAVTYAVVGMGGQSFSAADVAAYDEAFGVPPQRPPVVVGTNTPSACASNGTLCAQGDQDVELLTAIAQGGAATFWSVAGDVGTGEPFLEWARAVAAVDTPPGVFSISYFAIESTVAPATARAFDTQAAKLGLLGFTVLAASGDDGVGGMAARNNPAACGFNPYFPASSPHVTAVGATSGPESGSPEIACSSSSGGDITTGGGFSALFAQPSWQATVVDAYLAKGPSVPPTSLFPSKNRAYPDIAALGANVPSVVGGQTLVGSSTTASTPVVAAMLTLVNAQRLAAGKAPIGFLNPALYKLDAADAFHDVSFGIDMCCQGEGDPGGAVCCALGFTAWKGWDPLTGLGSPNFPKFAAQLSEL